jgi:hypothetical protein
MIIFRQEDCEVNNKVVMTTGNLIINDQVFKVASGGWGNGPIPSGLYKVEAAIRLPDTDKNATYRGEKFPWYARLTPLFKTDRDGLLIHPKGKYIGTLGCIEVWERELELFELLSELKGDCTLKVI